MIEQGPEVIGSVDPIFRRDPNWRVGLDEWVMSGLMKATDVSDLSKAKSRGESTVPTEQRSSITDESYPDEEQAR